MLLSYLFETKPYSQMSPKQAAAARRYRKESYKKHRKAVGRAASGSNETNKKTTKKWREENPEKASQVNRVNYRVRKGELPPVKPGKQRHHRSYEGEDGGKFMSIAGSTNAKKANEKREYEN